MWNIVLLKQKSLFLCRGGKAIMSQNAMKVTVKFQNNEFFASANINCPNNTEKELSFILNNDLVITSIFGENITYQKTDTI